MGYENLHPFQCFTGEIRRSLENGDKWNRINVLGLLSRYRTTSMVGRPTIRIYKRAKGLDQPVILFDEANNGLRQA